MIRYPKAFVKKAKDLFPTWSDLHELLDKNDIREVGIMLENVLGFQYDEEQIIVLFRNKKQHKILEAAHRARAKRELYVEWDEIVNEHSMQFVEDVYTEEEGIEF